jgi:formate hydrogenlyase subunit 3/multisubunit Na+/H+ antiporter MnhD subunit
MSAPIIWIVIPFAAAVVLWFLQGKPRLSLAISVTLCFLLGLIALFQNIDSAFRIGSIVVNIPSTLTILGRSFVLGNSNRIFLALIYLSMIFWYFSTQATGTSTKFIPLSLAIISLLTAALAVEPFLYSAILVELAVIISLPLLITRDKPVGKGILRYLIFQSLAMPFILLAGWILSGVQTSFSDLTQLYLAALFLGMGFAFWLGIFPFHFWIPEFCSENDIFINGFILSVFPVAFILIMLNFINGLTWLRDSVFLVPVLRVCGTLMIATGGIWAAMQKDLRKIIGYVAILQTGFLLVDISLQAELGVQLFYYEILVRALEMGLMTLALKVIQNESGEVNLTSLKGSFKEHPMAVIGLLVGLFSSAGLPLLGSFPIRTILLANLSDNPAYIVWILIGCGATLFIACTILKNFFTGRKQNGKSQENGLQILLFGIGIFFIVLIGLLPSVFLQGLWSKISVLLTIK